MLHKAKENNEIKGIKFCKNDPSISYLMFVDDLSITICATESNVMNCKNMLEMFCFWSGQKINVSKSSIMFSQNTNGKIGGQIKKTFCCLRN